MWYPFASSGLPKLTIPTYIRERHASWRFLLSPHHILWVVLFWYTVGMQESLFEKKFDKGEKLFIKGNFGFLKDPTLIVTDKNESGTLIELTSENDTGGGLLSGGNWYSADLIRKRL